MSRSSPPIATSTPSRPTTPARFSGPYAEPGHVGHSAYWHAADSVLAARRLSGLDPAGSIGSADGQARAQVAADIYDALPRTEREAIAAKIAETLDIAWLGHPSTPDEQAATRPGYAGVLTATLARRGHATLMAAPVHAGRKDQAEPVEVAYARRRQPSAPRPAPGRIHQSDRDQRILSAPRPPTPDVSALRHTRLRLCLAPIMQGPPLAGPPGPPGPVLALCDSRAHLLPDTEDEHGGVTQHEHLETGIPGVRWCSWCRRDAHAGGRARGG
jgi:hypothetical protein